jgi:hypothetical protein
MLRRFAIWWVTHEYLIALCGAIFSAFVYSRYKRREWNVLLGLWGFVILGVWAFVWEVVDPESQVPFRNLLAILVIYSVALYAVIIDALRFGLAAYLTRKRGEKWIKELDYFYLGLGAIGVMASLNRLEMVSGRDTHFDILGPLILATAVVIRFVKTRADIAGWNKIAGGPS